MDEMDERIENERSVFGALAYLKISIREGEDVLQAIVEGFASVMRTASKCV